MPRAVDVRGAFTRPDCANIDASLKENVIVVGGGIAGLTAAIYLARGGRTVTVFEKKRHLGGRAITHLRQGFRFNLGGHVVHRGAPGAAIYRELGIPLRGRPSRLRGSVILDGQPYRLPFSVATMLTSSLLSFGGKAELTKLLWTLRRIDAKAHESITAREWLDRNVRDARLRDVLAAVIRYLTYSDHVETLSAAVALEQLRAVLRRGLLYIDEGWQRIVDSLHSAAVTSGVQFVTSSRIVRVDHADGAVSGVELGGLELETGNDTLSIALPELPHDGARGTRLPAATVVLAVDPGTACDLVSDLPDAKSWAALTPVTAACLDVALSSLPDPRLTFALSLDAPLAMGVHSALAQLTPKGGALIHVAKYRKRPALRSDDELETLGARRTTEAAADEQELETFLDDLQPGWRAAVVHRRFLPSMTVANAQDTPDAKRPQPVTALRGLYLAGDWVGSEGILSDAALTSARAAAKAILAR